MSDFGDYIIIVNIILAKIEQKDAKERVKYAILSLAGSNLFSLRRADAAPEEKVDFS